RHLDRQAVAGDDACAELRVVDAPEPGVAGRRAGAPLREQDRGDLRHRLDHEHAPPEGLAGKKPLEVVLVGAVALDRLHAPAGLVLEHGVDQRGGIPVAETVQRRREVDRGHGVSVSAWGAKGATFGTLSTRGETPAYFLTSRRLMTSSERFRPGCT